MEEQAKSNAANAKIHRGETVQPEQSAAKQPPLKDKLQVVQNTLASVGMVGTLFVWGAANFYVGDVEIVPSRAYQNLSVQVFDRKGQETTYHTSRFQLMPGMYHVEVTADGSAKYPADIEVQFAHKRQLLVALGQSNIIQPSTSTSAQPGPSPAKDEHGQAAAAVAPAQTPAAALPQAQGWDLNARPQKQAELAPPQVSDQTQADEAQHQERNENHHWWQFRHKKAD